MIQPTYVTFEQSKLLLSKGLTREVLGYKKSSVGRPYYNDKGEFNGDCKEHIKKILNKEESILYPAPEQWEVIEWLRVKHGIWTSAWYNRVNKKYTVEYIIDLASGNNVYREEEIGYDSPQEAYSTAFDYILTKLIK